MLTFYGTHLPMSSLEFDLQLKKIVIMFKWWSTKNLKGGTLDVAKDLLVSRNPLRSLVSTYPSPKSLAATLNGQWKNVKGGGDPLRFRQDSRYSRTSLPSIKTSNRRKEGSCVGEGEGSSGREAVWGACARGAALRRVSARPLAAGEWLGLSTGDAAVLRRALGRPGSWRARVVRSPAGKPSRRRSIKRGNVRRLL